MYENHSLMLPSERYQEHLAMKAGEQQWRKERDEIFLYKKRLRILERHHGQGVVGIDGPAFEGTRLYAERREFLENQANFRAGKSEGRFQNLAQKMQSDDSVAGRNYGEPVDIKRSEDLCVQRKCVDPEAHPMRFLSTHDRLFPSYVPDWDPARAAVLRSHEIRDRTHNIITGASNDVPLRVAPRWDADTPDTTL